MVSIERSSNSEPDPYAGVYRDEQLQLVFTCCHPALPLPGRVALTLKTVAGLSTAQIARAFLVSEATMGQRLLRTRNKIAHTGIRLQVPEPHRLAERTAGVFAVIYLIFTEGYAAPDSEGAADLAAEAITAGRAAHPSSSAGRRSAWSTGPASAPARPPRRPNRSRRQPDTDGRTRQEPLGPHHDRCRPLRFGHGARPSAVSPERIASKPRSPLCMQPRRPRPPQIGRG